MHEACIVEFVHPDLDLRLELKADIFRVSFFDRGQSFDASRRRKLHVDPKHADRLPTGGMGIPLIHEIMDSIDYNVTPQGNVMTMEKKVLSVGIAALILLSMGHSVPRPSRAEGVGHRTGEHAAGADRHRHLAVE